MTERFIHGVRTELPDPAETAAEARVRLAEKFPRNAVRRMTHLGLMVGSVLDGTVLGPEDAVVYASSFAEARALEEYLRSFPVPSPSLFQASIHPNAVQQVLIGRQQPIARLWPLAGQVRLVEQALVTALVEPAARVAIVGGEERGTWLVASGIASAVSFAFAVLVTREAAGALGRIAFEPRDAGDMECPSLGAFARALAARSPLEWSGGGGTWKISWH
jgi:hypothetical protein